MTGLKFLFITFTHFLIVCISYEFINVYASGQQGGGSHALNGLSYTPPIVWVVLTIELIISMVLIYKNYKVKKELNK